MKTVVVLGGELAAGPRIKAALESADFVIAANGGAERLERIGIVPDVVIGDLDSIPDARLEELRHRVPELLRYPTRKDATDAELALDEAVARGATDITVIGAFGGPRTDHEIANVLLLAAPSIRGRDVRLLTDLFEAWAVCNSKRVFTAQPGDTVSLVPVGDAVAGVATHGLEWKLDNATLTVGSTYTISNAATSSQASVLVETGTVILFHYFGAGY
ncbi:MAG: thiamine diphosphokinase [Chloroflexi bacterium]|nr:thiamine diphosphokinase [Chloroflexota bacterium]MCY3937472.1 thiamine diphosphokinase [Chloroflexota bacterium]